MTDETKFKKSKIKDVDDIPEQVNQIGPNLIGN